MRVEALKPAFAQLLESEGWLPEAYGSPDLSSGMGSGIGQYALYRAEDGSLTLFSLVIPAGAETPVHDHLAWGLIGVYRGRQHETVYRRLDDGADKARADIEVSRAQTLETGEFYALLLMTALAICLAVSANNLVLIYISMEFLSITSYVLAGYFRHDRKSGEAALKYFLYGATASAIMLYGMSLIYGATGSTDLVQISAALDATARADLPYLAAPAILMMLVGFGFKALSLIHISEPTRPY